MSASRPFANPPLDKGGLQGGLERETNPRRSCAPLWGGSIRRRRTRNTNHPRRGLAPASPPRLRRGAQGRAFKDEHGSITAEKPPLPTSPPNRQKHAIRGEEKIGWEGHPGLRALKSLAPPWAIVFRPYRALRRGGGLPATVLLKTHSGNFAEKA